MTGEKKGFVLYFEMYTSIAVLPAEQRGELLSAMYEYAQEVVKREVPMEEVIQRHPQMTVETQMAFRFIAESIRRDTEKWREKHERYSQAAKARHEQKGNDDLKKYIARMRRKTEESSAWDYV